MKLKPARLLLDLTDYSDADLEPRRVYVERISADYLKKGMARLPHRFREAVGQLVDGVFRPNKDSAIERKRKYLINQGSPSTTEWTKTLMESMDGAFSTDDPP